jgi:hypothetical protein
MAPPVNLTTGLHCRRIYVRRCDAMETRLPGSISSICDRNLLRFGGAFLTEPDVEPSTHPVLRRHGRGVRRRSLREQRVADVRSLSSCWGGHTRFVAPSGPAAPDQRRAGSRRTTWRRLAPR